MARFERLGHREESGRDSSPRAGFLGLGRVIPRLIAEDGFEGREAALRSIAEYERFFLLAARQRSEPLVPSFRVDLIWQRHMLDTRAYAEDCTRWATAYLHRDSGAPTGGFERCLGLLGTFDRRVWDRPGPAFIHMISDESADSGPGGTLDREDFSDVLDRVRRSLRAKPTAPPWVVEARELLDSDATLAAEEYRRFLGLLIDERGTITPCKLVDEFWHQHILDSRNYARFCSRTAGRYLHHEPHYEKPHRSHTPAYRRTLLIYKERLGADPPGRVWAHMGESGGGGDGGSGDGTPPPPLYVVDEPCEVCAHLKLGAVDPRHYRRFHPVFTEKGLPRDLWHGLLRSIDAAPRISWAEFVAIKGNSPGRWAAATVGCWLGSVLFFLMLMSSHHAHHYAAEPISAGELLLGVSVVLGLFLLVGALSFAGRWSVRPYVSGEARRIVSRFAPVFRGHGVVLAELGDDAQIIQVEADTHREAFLRRQDEERQRLLREAEDRRLAAEAEQERHDKLIRKSVRRRAERARRRAERIRRRYARDSYYIAQGIEPGRFAWFHILPEGMKSILLWLAIVAPLALAINAWLKSF